MIDQEPYKLLKTLKRRYAALRLIEILLLAGGTVILTQGIAQLLTPPSQASILLAIGAGVIVFVLRAYQFGLFNLQDSSFVRFLNGQYPQLKESADLLVRSEVELTQLQQIQKLRTLNEFNVLYPQIRLPHHIGQAAGIAVACTVVYFGLSAFSATGKSPQVGTKSEQEKTIVPQQPDTTSAYLKSLTIKIIPPAYTQLQPFLASHPNLVVPEGSTVQWRAEFNRDASKVRMLFSGKDSVSLSPDGKSIYVTTRTITEHGFYHLKWTYGKKPKRTDYYRIEVIKDLPPRISIEQPGQFTKLLLSDNLAVDVKATLSDDYGLGDGQIVATVSKGSGESVKFREEKIRFRTPRQIGGKKVSAEVLIDLKKLGLEPGDEFYFYVEASDLKSPLPNYYRTETYFIALQDTSTEVAGADAGLGVDLLPEYFRSQRQIIIDTEKLLREKSKLTKKEFNSTSNELGYDQKVLRLRYGQFLGEEEDSGIGKQANEATEEGEEEDITAQYAHKHDRDNEHNLVDTKNAAKGEKKDGEKEEDPMKSLVHNHDNTEEATFFIQTVKAKLKTALTLMWDAELHLRLYEPAKSLPYQYKILDLLKEIANDSRIYVHRTGFDPPPLKEEKRLTADLDEVKSSSLGKNHKEEDQYQAIRTALALIQEMLELKEASVTHEAQSIFNKAGQELSGIAIEQPAIYLRTLALLKDLADQRVAKEEMEPTLIEIRKSLWRLLPAKPSSPSASRATTSRLDRLFIQSLDKVRDE
jgi:hypothetical protein